MAEYRYPKSLENKARVDVIRWNRYQWKDQYLIPLVESLTSKFNSERHGSRSYDRINEACTWQVWIWRLWLLWECVIRLKDGGERTHHLSGHQWWNARILLLNVEVNQARMIRYFIYLKILRRNVATIRLYCEKFDLQVFAPPSELATITASWQPTPIACHGCILEYQKRKKFSSHQSFCLLIREEVGIKLSRGQLAYLLSKKGIAWKTTRIPVWQRWSQ